MSPQQSESADPDRSHRRPDLVRQRWRAAAIISTPDDVLMMLGAIVGARLFPADLVAEMVEPERGSYGLGLGRYDFRCGTFYGHNGLVDGTHSTAGDLARRYRRRGDRAQPLDRERSGADVGRRVDALRRPVGRSALQPKDLLEPLAAIDVGDVREVFVLELVDDDDRPDQPSVAGQAREATILPLGGRFACCAPKTVSSRVTRKSGRGSSGTARTTARSR